MGAATSSARRDSRGEEDAAAEELTAAGSDAPEDGSAICGSWFIRCNCILV